MSDRSRRRLLVGVACGLLLGLPSSGKAAVKVELLVVGNNNALVESPTSSLTPLRYADDDAAAFYELLEEVSDRRHLLTVMDAQTQVLYPRLAGRTRPPTLAALRDAVADLSRSIDENRRRGDQSIVYLFFSGHGITLEGRPALALLDGGLSQQVLYDEILGGLAADYVHVFVDACHAEAVVRPRDTEARPVPIRAAEANAFLVHSTLTRFPHVGAVVAATSDAQAHEWDHLSQGVFTHELLSALRGAADVNQDARIEYSEIYAFLGAANRNVDDPRVRLRVVARPPEIDRHVSVLDLSLFPRTRNAELRGVPARAGLVEVEDRSGRRLATLHGETGFVANLVVPAGTTYVRTGDKEARFESRPGDVISFDQLGFRASRTRTRGALEDAMNSGLFAGEFGRSYYLGFIDQSPDFVPVRFTPPAQVARAVRQQANTTQPADWPSLIVGMGISTPVATEMETSQFLRVGLRTNRRSGAHVSLDLARAAGAEVAEWGAIARAGWLWSAHLGVARGWVGATLESGLIAQTAAGTASRWSGVIAAGPTLGGAVALGASLGLWAEAGLSLRAFRGDSQIYTELAPSGVVGVSLAL